MNSGSKIFKKKKVIKNEIFAFLFMFRFFFLERVPGKMIFDIPYLLYFLEN